MAFAQDIRSLEAGLADRISAAFREFAERRALNRRYRETRDQLASLSDRDLADLGIHRSMINSVAREAAYGK